MPKSSASRPTRSRSWGRGEQSKKCSAAEDGGGAPGRFVQCSQVTCANGSLGHCRKTTTGDELLAQRIVIQPPPEGAALCLSPSLDGPVGRPFFAGRFVPEFVSPGATSAFCRFFYLTRHCAVNFYSCRNIRGEAQVMRRASLLHFLAEPLWPHSAQAQRGRAKSTILHTCCRAGGP